MKTQKTGGRQKGTPNRTTSEIRNVLKELVLTELASLPERLDKLQPTQRIDVLIKLAPFVLPKIEHAKHTIDEPISWHN